MDKLNPRVRVRNRPTFNDCSLGLFFVSLHRQVSVVEASPERVEPQCSLFGRCGGCQYQHVSCGRGAADLKNAR